MAKKLFTFVTEQDYLCVVTEDNDEQDKELPTFITINVADNLGDTPEIVTITKADMDMLCGLWLSLRTDKAVK